MIKAGLGLGFLPEHAVSDPDLVVPPLVEPGYSRMIYVATVRGRPHSPAVEAFVQEARRFPWPIGDRAPAGQGHETGLDPPSPPGLRIHQ